MPSFEVLAKRDTRIMQFSPNDRIAPEIEGLVRLLVTHSTGVDDNQFSSAKENAAAEVVLMDMEVDGARYLLIRMPHSDCQRVQLSPREHEIVRMVAQGQCNKVIADLLNISSWTVCTHMRRIFAKLGVTSRAAMIARVNEIGIQGRH